MGLDDGQKYSNIIVYDELKKYYYMWPRKNRPLLDDEQRNLHLSLMDQVRRATQHEFGDVGAPTNTYLKAHGAPYAANGFKVAESSTDKSQNFTITGNGSTEHPAVLYVRGFYVFLTGNIEYKNQNDLGAITAAGYTKTAIPNLTDPAPGVQRVDVVYVDLHFEEATATTSSTYTDTGLKNPIVGTETASRARAVFDVRVWEDYRFKNRDGTTRASDITIDSNIFSNSDFLGVIEGEMVSDPTPTNKHYRVPIAIILRDGSNNITNSNIIDLLDLYDKRILSLEELTHRTQHGGYTQRDVTEVGYNTAEVGYSGLFNSRYPNAVVDEGAYATGPGEGFGTEALNADAVTPRVLDSDGKFGMGALQVGVADGGITGAIDFATGPVQLADGELIAGDISANSLYMGYHPGLSGVREYRDRINVHMEGVTNAAGVAVINDTGETGAVSFRITGAENYHHVDYKGRYGINTDVPGWSGPATVWNDGSEIVQDVNGSSRIIDNQFVEGNSYVGGAAHGKTWRIPSVIDRENAAVFGFTGVPQHGITGSPASVQVVPGIAVVGATGSIRGYTGTLGFYEAYDADGTRAYTIGSRGDDYDRQVLSLYGVGDRDVFVSDIDFTVIPGLTGSGILAGDEIRYVIDLAEGGYITGAVTGLYAGLTGLNQVVDDINSPTGGQMYRYFAYDYEHATEYGETGPAATTTYTGAAYGAAINYEGEEDDSLLRVLVKSMPEINKTVEDVDMTIIRTGYPTVAVDFIQAGYYGSGGYGGDLVDLNFVKFDLGTAADAWLFEGDVFFNGNGLQNKVVFSPNAIFRDDVFVYGKLSAQEIQLSIASIIDLRVQRRASVGDYFSVLGGFALGYGTEGESGFNTLDSMFSDSALTNYNLLGTVNGGLRVNNILFTEGEQSNYEDFGAIWELNKSTTVSVGVVINGTHDDSDWPFGVHLIDRRGLATASQFSTFVFDAHAYQGDPPTLRNMKLWVKGDLEVGVGSTLGGGALIRRLTLGTSATEIDTNYALSLTEGNAFISNLTVDELHYSSTSSGAGSVFFEPQNIKVIEETKPESDRPKDDGILRTKQFSVDTFTQAYVTLKNYGEIATDTSYTSFASGKGLWANDTLTFEKTIIDAFDTENNTITSDENFNNYNALSDETPVIENWRYYRNNFSRIILLTLGRIKIIWRGLTSQQSISQVMTAYEFSSSLFKVNEAGSNVFNWLSSPTNVHMIRISGSFNNADFDENVLYNIEGSLGVYIPPSLWTLYTNAVSGNYERYYYLSYNNVIQNYHVIEASNQNTSSSWGGSKIATDWEVGIFPKIREQKYYGEVGQSTSSDLLYEATWDMNVVLYPKTTGTVNNLVGEIKISYE